MCGFAGYVRLSGLSGEPEERRKILGDMLSLIAHRGPDDETYYDDGFLAVGFRRLSIIDVEGGRQPMHDRSLGVVAVVNGEIYNHRELRTQLREDYSFRSKSDSEVLLPLYRERGLGLFDQVNGIYAAMLWDSARRKLILARDRLGVKPLYFTMTGDTLLFASELKALLAHPDCPREPDPQQVRDCMALHVPVPPSFVKDVHHLPAAHLLVLEPGRAPSALRYWAINEHFANPESPAPRPAEHYAERYGALLADSISKQLMSDVPLGVFLSGGIDSSLVTAAASRELGAIQCFTIDEETTAMTGDLGQARRVAGDLSLPLDTVRYRGEKMLDELQFDLPYFEAMIWCVDSPRFNLEWFFKFELYRYAKTQHPGIKVILTGAGADEFAGGYSSSYRSDGGSWDAYLESHVKSRSRLFRARERNPAWFDGPGTILGRDRNSRSGYQHMMYMNLVSLQVYNLWYEDRVSAAHGIEARVPFLDHRLVELLVSVPPQHFEALFWNKQIIREQLRNLLPSYPADFPKVPFVFVPGNRSIQALRLAVITKVFRDFVDKYAGEEDTLAPAGELERHYQAAISGSPEAGLAQQRLIRIMQVAVFRELCLSGWKNPPAIPRDSPLTAA